MATPPLQIYVRGKEGSTVMQGVPQISRNAVLDDATQNTVVRYNKDGSMVAGIDNERLRILDTSSGLVKLTIHRPGINQVAFSPLGSFLVTWQKLTDDLPTGNLCCWNLDSGELQAHAQQKNLTRSLWPMFNWSEDESICGRMVTNEVHFFDGKDPGGAIVCKLRLPGISQWSLSPGSAPYKVAAFVAEKKGAPARVQVFSYDNLDAPTCSKSFFKAQTVDITWDSTGYAILVQTHTDVDKTGKSYYGETGLFYLQADGGFDANVQLQKEGPIYDVQWSPNGEEFVVLHGFMPARALLLDRRCRVVHDFGSGPLNTCKWNPQGRYLMLGGFGNLAGEMHFWDRKHLKRICIADGSCSSSAEWAPDGVHFMCAILFPRMRVDNGIKIFTVNGNLVYQEKILECNTAEWRPSPCHFFPPLPTEMPEAATPTSDTSSIQKTKVAPYRPGAMSGKYRPPNSTGVSIDIHDYDPREEDKLAAALRSQRGAPVGAETAELSKGASKNAKKRANKKKEGGGAQQGGGETDSAPVTPRVTSIAPVGDIPVGTDAEIAKKIKKVNSKLFAVTKLKDDQAAGKTLEKNQLDKLEQEAGLLKELAALQLQAEENIKATSWRK